MTPEMREEMIIPYIPELPIATEDLINYNQTVLRTHGIKTAYVFFKLKNLIIFLNLLVFVFLLLNS